MKRASFADMDCSIAQALEEVGEWWTLLILRDLHIGVTRFEDLHQRLGISRNMLTIRLDKLVADDIIERRPYSEHPPRFDYVLTPKGRDLWRVLTVLRQWGDRWIMGRGAEPVVMVHEACGKRVSAELHCNRCGERIKPGQLVPKAGPGAGVPDLVTGAAERG